MAELKILRVFLIAAAFLSSVEIKCEEPLSEDYYSFEDPENATSPDSINKDSDVGSGDGELGDLSPDHNATEDLPGADEIFKAFEADANSQTETSVARTTAEGWGSTGDEHVKRIFEKLGVTVSLLGSTTTENAEEGFEEEFLLRVSSEKVKNGEPTKAAATESSVYDEKPNKIETNTLNQTSDELSKQNVETATVLAHTTLLQLESTTPPSLHDSTLNLQSYYENYVGSLEELENQPQTSATVDPAMYEYEARSSEDESTICTTLIGNDVTSTTERARRMEKELDLEKQHKIDDKLNFEGTTESTTDGWLEVFTTKGETSTESRMENFEPTVKIDSESFSSVVTQYDEFRQSETTVTLSYTTDTTEISTRSSETETTLAEESADEYEFETYSDNARFITSDILNVTPVNNETQISNEAENENEYEDGDTIPITTDVSAVKILTKSVSLVTENTSEPNVQDSYPCLKLNFTGQIKTQESVIPIPNNATIFGLCQTNGVFVNITWDDQDGTKVRMFLNFTEDLLTNVQINLLHNNKLFEQSKKVELGSTYEEVTVEFDNRYTLELTFFEFSTLYDTNSTNEYEPIPSTEKLQYHPFVLEIIVGCVGVVLIIAAAGFYTFKKYRGQRDSFKTSSA